MRAIVLAGIMMLAGAAWAQDGTWSCTASDMRVCWSDGKCTKAESRPEFQIRNSGADGEVEFCPKINECRSFGKVLIEADGEGYILKGATAGFTGFIGGKSEFQAAGRFKSNGKIFTYAAAGKCRPGASKPASSSADIMRDTDRILRDGRAAQFRLRYYRAFPEARIFCNRAEDNDPCRSYSVYPAGGVSAGVNFGFQESETGTKISAKTGYVSSFKFTDRVQIRDALEKLAKVADDRLSVPSSYLPDCESARRLDLGGSLIIEALTSDGRCEITIQTE